MTDFNTLKKQMLSNPDVNREYQALAPEYALARQLIEARSAAGLSQADVAARMGTKQSEVSRIETGRQNVSMAKLRQYAEAVGKKVQLSFI